MLCNDLEGWDREGGREAQEGGDMCMHMADSLCCATVNNTVLCNNYTPVKIYLKKFYLLVNLGRQAAGTQGATVSYITNYIICTCRSNLLPQASRGPE